VGAFFKSPQLKVQVPDDMQCRLAPTFATSRDEVPGARIRILDHARTVCFRSSLLRSSYKNSILHCRFLDFACPYTQHR
jgi:hypothetical protein